MIDETLIAHDQAQFEQYKPYLWSPTHPEYGSFIRGHLETLKNEGFFEGTKGVQLMAGDDEVSRRVAEQIAKPYLAELGVTNVRTDYVDSSSNATLSDTGKRVIVAGDNAGMDRVVAIGGSRILPVALSNFEASEFDSIWCVRT